VRTMTFLRAAALTLGGIAAGVTPVRAQDPPRTIAISARRFEFNPPEITLKAGETVRLELTSQDVTHGFFVRPLGIDELIEPGHPTVVVVTPKVPGRYTTICDHFCGAGHGGMKMTIVVE
jgi:cytochrome c oxidase subunit 2